MGHASHVLHMIFIIVFFLISFSCTTHILISNVQVDGNKDQEKAQILEKFRFLLQLGKSFSFGKSRNVEFSTYISSPSPSPSLAPAPSPAVRIHHRRAHPPLHHHHSLPQPQKVPKKEQGKKAARVLTAVLASFGVTFAFCAIGLFCVCLKLKKNKRKQRTRIISRFISSSQSSVKKVSSDPGPDLFYLDSLESALEPEKSCPTKLNNTLISCASDEREGSNNKLLVTNSECDESDGCCSNSFGEITTVHEISEQCDDRGSNSSCGERITPEEIHAFEDKTVREETHSSDDESFHSFCDSQSSSSHLRLSNASASSSLAQISEILSQEEQNAPPPEILSQSPPPSAAPPPPPPPPPPPQSSPPFPNPSSGKKKSHFLNSPQLQDLSQTSLETHPNPPAGVPAPPPCPPPLPKGQIFSLKIPPPPPNSGITQQIPLGKDGSPLTKLKPLHWDKVRAAPNRSTVWDKLHSSSFEFDEEMIESLFSYNLQNTTKNDEVRSKTPSPSKHVLEPKRLQNITILSKGLNVTAEQVCGALLRGDGLSLQDLEALSKMVPTKEEEDKLANYKGDIIELGSAEKLVKAMLKIPFAFARIEAMLYRETFQDEVLHLTKSFSMLQEACEELRSSRLFLKLLEAVLKTGNRMNVGTIRGGAKAFKLDALLKLSDVKGTDGKTTLLHFVVQEIIRSEGIRVSESIMGKIHQKSSNSNSNTTQDKEAHYHKMGLDLVSGLSSELCNAKKTATIDLDVLATSVATLSEGLRQLKNLVEKEMMLVHDEKKGTFVDNLRCFVKHAETKLKEVRDEENRVLMNVREITEYFHGDVGKDEANPLRIFVIVRDFLSMLDNVCKELRSSKAPRSHNPLAPFR